MRIAADVIVNVPVAQKPTIGMSDETTSALHPVGLAEMLVAVVMNSDHVPAVLIADRTTLVRHRADRTIDVATSSLSTAGVMDLARRRVDRVATSVLQSEAPVMTAAVSIRHTVVIAADSIRRPKVRTAAKVTSVRRTAVPIVGAATSVRRSVVPITIVVGSVLHQETSAVAPTCRVVISIVARATLICHIEVPIADATMFVLRLAAPAVTVAISSHRSEAEVTIVAATMMAVGLDRQCETPNATEVVPVTSNVSRTP